VKYVEHPGRAQRCRRAQIGRCSRSLVGKCGLAVHFPIRKGVLRHTVGAVKAVDGIGTGFRVGGALPER